MPLISWNEVRDRALQFSREWAGETSENAEKQTFWNEFFDVFGLRRRNLAMFEARVQNIRGKYGYIDLFAPGSFLVEHKSAGKSLEVAASQAYNYSLDLIRENRLDICPRFIIVTDFARISLIDLEPGAGGIELPLVAGRRHAQITFALADLHKYVREFAFIRNEKPVRLDPEDPANLEATRRLAGLHDALEDAGYIGHALERYLVRLLFCLFAEDTGIFEPGQFTTYIIDHTREDGSDLGLHLAQLFEVLDQVDNSRMQSLDDDLAGFPYVNGALFSERLPIVSFNKNLRDAVLACCEFRWAKISPAIFGSLFQGVMDAKERRQLGAHYTSERDILKLLRSLFLDDLNIRLEAALNDRSTRRGERLRDYIAELRRLRIFDPACGCGNFLILAYRELRALETRALISLHSGKTLELDVRELAQVDVDQIFGLEIVEWPVRIAEVGLWLVDHQCNLELAEALGRGYRRLPLRVAPALRVANALSLDWSDVLPASDDVLVLGNPPFVGKHYQTAAQKGDTHAIFAESGNAGDLDYVACWFVTASRYIQGTRARCGFVSTNSITQGEQVPLLWKLLFEKFSIKIHFAHRTFKWVSEARGKAHVHVVIVGFGAFDRGGKRLFEYAGDDDNPVCLENVANISPYLTVGPDLYVVKSRSALMSGIPDMRCGSKPSDGGNLIFTDAERREFLRLEPEAKALFRRFCGSEEFLNGGMRWCLWLHGVDPTVLRKLPHVRGRIEKVRQFRRGSTAAPTRAAADRPSEFFYISQPSAGYIAMPEVSSERRKYIPVGYLPSGVIASNKLYVIGVPDIFLFGILASAMHMAWIRVVCGRLKSDYQYSATMVYYTFPWPTDASEKHRAAVQVAAQGILDARRDFPKSSLADLYDPLNMPPILARAHGALDRAVDRCYRPGKFISDQDRFEHALLRYQQLSGVRGVKAGLVKK